ANLTVYNMAGQAVATLVNGVVSAGARSVVFDASELTSGVYFYTLNVAGRSMTEKMVLVK
ncbi:MAG: T9SS type A sorting domain-containing protein, partial [Calditrichaeota bacterium]|nr:T9SS type A sorting domain-containing protein [Calditrichota bacterium]